MDIIYEGQQSLQKVKDNYDKPGVSILCPVCGAKLQVAFTKEEAKEFGKIPGIYCPEDQQHVQLVFNPGRTRNPTVG